MPRAKKQELKQRADGRYACRYKDKWFMGASSDEALAAREEYKKKEIRGELAFNRVRRAFCVGIRGEEYLSPALQKRQSLIVEHPGLVEIMAGQNGRFFFRIKPDRVAVRVSGDLQLQGQMSRTANPRKFPV